MASSDLSLLDNPIWHSLNGPHAKFAVGKGLARRYTPDVSPFFAISEVSDAAYDDLRALAGTDVPRMLALAITPERPGWTKTFEKEITQMIWQRPTAPFVDPEIVELSPRDVPEMTRLVEATKPGPWAPRTIEMGRYCGIKVDGRLAAMAGERMRMPGITEVSAVAVWPELRGRGYAQRLTRFVASSIVARGDTAFLHLFADNTPARALYEKLGFVKRQKQLYFVWLQPSGPR